MKASPLKFRPHHFLCTLSFQGEGYSDTFVANYKAIVQKLSFDEDTLIQVVKANDAICTPCPHRLFKSQCTFQSKIDKLDKAHAEALQIEAGYKTTWRGAKQRMKERISLSRFHKICDGCEWKKFGYCEQALQKLLNERPGPKDESSSAGV